MKKFVLPGLVMVGIVAVALFGVWWFKVRGERIGVKMEDGGWRMEETKEEQEAREKREAYPSWLGNYVTLGVVKKEVLGKEQVISVNGRFVSLKPVPGSSDKYLVLDASSSETPLLRLVFRPHSATGIDFSTQVSLLSARRTDLPQDRVRLMGDLDKLSAETLDMVFAPGNWLSALPYKDSLGQVIKDEAGAYYVRALTLKEVR